MIPLKPFYFIRHGETDWNKRGVIMGHKDIELNSNGISQAQEAKSRFKSEKIGHIYASSLKHASHTAQILNEELNLPITHSDLLKERCWGVSEGDSVDNFKELFLQPVHKIGDDEIPVGAETWGQLRGRIALALHELLNASDETPLIVAHGGVFMALLAIMELPDMRTKNCVPYLFHPPHDKCNKWKVANLGDDWD